MRKAEEFKLRDPKIRTFEIIQYITGPIECESMKDLSPKMQDQIMTALELKAQQEGLRLQIIGVRCDKDIDSTDPRRTWFLHVIASEVVIVVPPGGLH